MGSFMRPTIGGNGLGASIAITRGISISNATFPTNSATSKDGRNVLFPCNIAFTSLLNIQFVLMTEYTVSGCGSKNNRQLSSGNKERLGGLKYA